MGGDTGAPGPDGGWLAAGVPRLQPGDVACWVVKSSLPLDRVSPGWAAGQPRELDRCLRPSYRLELMAPGQPCLLWVSGRDRPGVHALGVLAAVPVGSVEGPVVAVRLARLAEPVDRGELLADPAVRDAEVLRMPAGSNPSWLTAGQYAALLDHVGTARPLPGQGWDHGVS